LRLCIFSHSGAYAPSQLFFANVDAEVRGFAGFFSIYWQKGLNNSQTN
jgi:hypothetical protein